ncbi:hypothetical protein ACVNF4_08410 [Streptomyces sp. S6]
MSTYGREDSEWRELTFAGREFLIELAGRRKDTNYTELSNTLAERTGCRAFDFSSAGDRAAMGHLLWLIVREDQQLDPAEPALMLSALVIYLNANDAGSGFYGLAKDLGLLSLSASKEEREIFWVRQLNGLYERHAAR